MPEITLRFYGYLSEIASTQETTISLPILPSVKHLLEHCGIPHTEIDLVVCDGETLPLHAHPPEGSRLAIYPRWHTLPIEHNHQIPDPIRFVLDVHLGKLARLLRMMGFDTLYETHFSDQKLISLSQTQKRILLTRDKGILYHNTVTYGHWVRSQDPLKQLKEILDLYELFQKIQPFSRCLVCNGELQSIEKSSILHLLPPRVQSWCSEFWQCNQCQRVYWKGSHYDHMQTTISHILRSPLDK